MGSTSLNLRVPWEAVLTALQIPFCSKALPLHTRCPLCGQDRLSIYHDNITGGQWHHCEECGSGGDMIELACAAWGVEPYAAIRKLSAAGVLIPPEQMNPEIVNRYYAAYPGRRRRMTELWHQAQPQLIGMAGDAGKVMAKLGLRLDASRDRWLKGPCRLAGIHDSRAAEIAFHPHVENIDPSIGVTNALRLFKGRKWGKVLCIPWHDLPDRIAAWTFYGRHGDRLKDEVFRQCLLKSNRTEAGLAFYDAIELSGNPRHVIAVEDWALGLQVHFRNFRGSMRALPIVAWRDDGRLRTQQAWNMIGDKRVIFWCHQLSPKLIRQAVETDGMISMAGPVEPNPKSMNHYFRLHPGTDLERIVIKQARPWDQMLKAWALTATSGDVDNLWAGLEACGADLAYIERKLGHAFSGRLEAPTPVRCVNGGGDRQIFEQHDRWYSNSKGRRFEVMNCTFRFTHAIKDKASGEVFYRGVVKYDGQEAAFLSPVEYVRENTLRWLGEIMTGNGLGVVSVHNRYKNNLHHIAIQFNEPRLVTDDISKWAKAVASVAAVDMQ